MQNEQESFQPPTVAQRQAVPLRAACLRKGWSIDKLARRAGLSRTTLYQLQRGAIRRPRASTVCRIATALEIEPTELFGAEGAELADCSPASLPVLDPADPERRRVFDRRTNPVVAEVSAEFPGLFLDWTDADWDELYSSFGTGGRLTRQGVVNTAGEMNRKRETIRQLHVVLETHLAEVAVRMIETLYDLVRPDSPPADTSELETWLAQHSATGAGQPQKPAE